MERPVQLPQGELERPWERNVRERRPGYPAVRAEARRDDPTIASYVWLLVESRWLVLGIALATVALGALYLLVASPVFQARSIVQVELKRRTPAGLEDLSSALGEGAPAEPEIEIIRSRTLLGGVVDELKLDIETKPRAFPLIGKAIARRYDGEGPASPLLKLSRFAWGGERIRVGHLAVPSDLVEVPLLLTAGEEGTYRVSDGEEQLLEGSVGELSSKPDRGLEISVSELVARPGTQFWITRRNREHVIDELLEDLTVQEKGKRTGILTIELTGQSPTLVSSIVNAIATAYLRQNVEHRSAEAAKTLEFLESQLPKVKATVDAAEKALNEFKASTRSVDTSAETRGLLERAADLEKEIADAEVRRAELRQSFTENHPNLIALANKLALLRAEHAQLTNRMRALPQAELRSASLAREMEDATKLYVGLLNRAQELRIAKSGTIGDVRIIDRAHIPDVPYRPKKALVLLISMLLGLGAGVAAAIARRSWVERAESPEEVEAITGVPVYVAVPHSEAQAQLSRASRRKRGRPAELLSQVAPHDVAMETVRSLRTSLQFALVESPNNVVAMTGPAPGVGKSFLAINLAQVLAAAGKEVLLLDCDLRRGSLHRQVGLDRAPGLSDVVSGTAQLADAIRDTAIENLYLLPTGRIPPNPAELLASHRFEALVQDVSKRFDLVLVDTPPLLAVTDAMLVARFAGVNFLVLRSGMHTTREVVLSVKQFELNGVKLHGTVLNDVAIARSGYGRYGHIRYEYSSEAE